MDRLLVLVQLALSALGILGVAAAASGEWHQQLLRVVLCLLITAIVARISPRTVVRISPVAYVFVLVLLIAVLVVGISPPGNDSRRWLALGGFTLQPSELMKVTVIAYLTAFFYNHLGNWQIWRPMIVMGFAAGAIVAEPDVSTALFIFVLAFAIMLAAGTTLTRLISITVAGLLLATLLAAPYLSHFSYIGKRITGFGDLWGSQAQAQGSSYQALQAQRALERAGLFGLGPGLETNVPEADTDMVAISIGHALGLLGIATLIALFAVIAVRGVQIAGSLTGPGALLAAGATTYICGQAALNLLVASGLAPVTGIPLPFVSYGFNSLISIAIAMGLIHSGYRQAKRQEVLA
jgi:cell division protein FtsW